MWRHKGCAFEHVPLGSHVAVRDGSPLALPAHCTAGDDCRDRGRQGRAQEPAHPRRVFQLGWPGASRGHWRWDILSLALRWCSRFALQGFSWRHSSAGQREFQRLFWSLPTNPSRIHWESAGGILRQACSGDSTKSAGACGERPDWPVSDHFSRRVWKQRRSGGGGEGPLRELWGPMVECVEGSLSGFFLTKLNSLKRLHRQ